MQSIKGVTETGSVLDRIVADLVPVREAAMRNQPEAVLRDAITEYDGEGPWGLRNAIATPRGHAPASAGVHVIAEVKKASPSKGVLVETIDPVAIARAYASGGAAGISVVTEPNYFQGNIEWLRDVRKMLSGEFPGTRPSLLRKDFVVHPYEVLQARAYGADNVLLIVAMLELDLMRDLLDEAKELQLDALVEVHTEAEAERAIEAGATLFGINNRDLHTFNVDLATTERIRPLLPADAIVVGESGVHKREDVERLQRAGVRAILVGEAFMTAPDVAAKMAELRPISQAEA
jgi:indole-3-glycerol phosphate synthase